MTLQYEDLRARDSTNMDRDFFNRRYRLIAENIQSISTGLAQVEAATENLVKLGLARIDEVLSPALLTVQAAAENNFLVAPSDTALTLTVGLETSLQISDESLWGIFAPTPYILIARDADAAPDDWALARLQSYNRDTGGLAFEVVAVSGTVAANEYSAWVVSASAGLGKTILDAAAALPAIRDEASAAAAQASDAAAAAEAVLESGPVTSVNGQTGEVSIVMADIPNLVALLGSKADTSHGHTTAQVTGLEDRLVALETGAGLTDLDGGSY